ncbi:MAG: DUF721 domain-containing protein [Cytophagales bacterium]|nr:DUF721 domain-containing protein [Cytophagales bacterium]
MKKTSKKTFVRTHKAMPLAEAINLFLRSYRLDKRFVESKIPLIWKNTMGEVISSRTTKIFVNDHYLYLKVSSAPLKKELMMNKDLLIAKINKEVDIQGFIREVRFL